MREAYGRSKENEMELARAKREAVVGRGFLVKLRACNMVAWRHPSGLVSRGVGDFWRGLPRIALGKDREEDTGRRR